jgi:mannose-6-phosphate isomerase-like protein (cupin superfamily)
MDTTIEFAPQADPLDAFLFAGRAAIAHLASAAAGDRLAISGRVRGTGPGVSFRRLWRRVEDRHSRRLESPFEGVGSIAGAVWHSADYGAAWMKLCFEAGTTDLPAHSHDQSARFIIVLEGRGFFHSSDEPLDAFTGRAMRSVAVRERDALLFTAGIIHTFSAPTSPLVLLSYHAPFVALDAPEQYTIAEPRWTPASVAHAEPPVIRCDPAWSTLARSPRATTPSAVARDPAGAAACD